MIQKSLTRSVAVLATGAINNLYQAGISESDVVINETRPEFEGDYTLVLFSLLKQIKQKPDVAGNEIGTYLVQHNPGFFTGFNVIKGFLNLTIAPNEWLHFLQNNFEFENYGFQPANGKKIMVEYASPNSNKPLHLGHLRNIFLGWSTSKILQACGYEVIKSCIVNDRGIHICKSMIAWKQFGNNATPETTGIKGDHLVGDYYVKFNDVYQT